MLRSYQYYRCRREALGWTQQELADRANVFVGHVINMEYGLKIPYETFIKIKECIRNEFASMDKMEHYKRRNLELAMELLLENDPEAQMNMISHAMFELAKIQKQCLGIELKTKEDWEEAI